jgi:hypothetical protein
MCFNHQDKVEYKYKSDMKEHIPEVTGMLFGKKKCWERRINHSKISLQQIQYMIK